MGPSPGIRDCGAIVEVIGWPSKPGQTADLLHGGEKEKERLSSLWFKSEPICEGRIFDIANAVNSSELLLKPRVVKTPMKNVRY